MVEITDKDGSILYTVDGEYHRSNGPAWVDKSTNNGWWWWLNGKWHRYYGPVSSNYVTWRIHGEQIK